MKSRFDGGSKRFGRYDLRKACRAVCVAEPLESRTLLAAITWTNRGAASDRFGEVFGANAAAARIVVDAAISSWARVIDNFNFPGGGNTYSMVIAMDTTGVSHGASAGPTHYNSANQPDQGSMTIGRGDDGPDTDVDVDNDGVVDVLGDGLTYFLDPTPFESSEFITPGNAFQSTANAAVSSLFDLYTVTLHEMGHALGLLSTTRMNALATNTLLGDTINSPGAVANYWRFDSGSVHTLWTGYDSGEPNNRSGTQHYANAGAIYTNPATGIVYRGANDLMNASYSSGERKLISHNNLTTLSQAYGYSVKSATAYGSFYGELDASGKLSIDTPGSGNDSVTITSVGGILTVSMAIGSPVLGADPTTFASSFDANSVSSIEINTSTGSDTITLGGNLPTVRVFGGVVGFGGDSDNDTLIISGATGTIGVTSDTVTSAVHNVTRISGIENLVINGTAANENFFVSGVPSISSVAINAGNGTNNLFLGGGDLAFYIDSLIAFTYTGGTGGDGIIISNENNTTLNWVYEIFSSSMDFIAAGYFLNINFSSVEAVTISGSHGSDQFYVGPNTPSIVSLSGNEGDDTFNIGGGNLLAASSQVTFTGGNGSDKLILNDSTSSTTLGWTVRIGIIYLGINEYSYSAFEAVEVLANSLANDFLISGATVPVTLRGGNGNDTFRYVFTSTAAIDVTSDGQGGTDTMTVDDRNWGGSFSTAVLHPTYLRRFGVFTVDTYARYTGVESVIFFAEASASLTYIYGTSAAQTTLNLSSSSDDITVFPHDAAGNLTINGNIGIYGNGGNDAFSINDQAYAVPINYTVFNPSGTSSQNFLGLGTANLGTAGVEQHYIRAGDGDDTFNVDQYKTGTGLTIYAGHGDDVLNFGGSSVAVNITNIGSLLFDGQTGFDRFNLNNTNDTGAWTYTRTSSTILSTRTSYGVILNDLNTEEMTVNAGPGTDTFLATSTRADTNMIFYGNGGIDLCQPGVISVGTSLANLHGRITYDAGGIIGPSGGTLALSASSDQGSRTVHQTSDSIGAHSDDNLFGAGGSVYFQNLTSVTLFTSGFADTIYATPLTEATVSINGNPPFTFPGDQLFLALGGTSNPILTPNGSTAGTYTFSSHKNLSYSSIESVVADETSPNIVSILFDPTPGAHYIAYTFDEDVSASLSKYSLYLYNYGTGSYLSWDDIEYAYDNNVATFTFPTLGGVLPGGSYGAVILGATDAVGNAAVGNAIYNFIWTPGTAGADEFRVALDPTATVVEVYENDDVTPSYTAGLATLNLLWVSGGDGDDRLVYDVSNGLPTALGVPVFDGGEGADTMTGRGSVSVDTAVFGAAGMTLNGGGMTELNVEAHNYDGNGEFDFVTVDVGLVWLSTRQWIQTLAVADGAGVAILPGGDKVVVIRDLAIVPGGAFDLTDNAAVIDYGDPSPLTSVLPLLASGYNGGLWTGTGIGSSVAAADVELIHSVGYAEAFDLLGLFDVATDVWQGQTVDSTAILLRYTFTGDTDLSGALDGADLANSIEGLSVGGNDWTNGDFDFDGVADATDYQRLLTAYTLSSTPRPGPSAGGRPGLITMSGAKALVVVGPSAEISAETSVLDWSSLRRRSGVFSEVVVGEERVLA